MVRRTALRKRRIGEPDETRSWTSSRACQSYSTGPLGGAGPRLARRHGLTVYDAAYLELALRKGLDLATLDDASHRESARASR